MILSVLGGNIAGGFVFVCLLVILYLMLRRKLYAGLILFAVIAIIQVLFFTHSLVFLPFTLIISLLTCLVISRLGLVAAIVAGTVHTWMLATLFTLNFSAWYTGGMFLTLFLIFSLLAYGFKISLSNQTLFSPVRSFES